MTSELSLHAVDIWMALAGYLIGSISFAVVVSRIMGLPDPHDYGSGNPGATNVLRTGNRKAAVATLLGDMLKGVIAVLVARAMAPVLGLHPLTPALVGAAAFVGHLFPVFHRFRGGKGVATAGGVLLAMSPWVGVGTVATWLVVARLTRYSSLAALCAALIAPVLWLLVEPAPDGALVVGVISALLIWRHAVNIRKLLDGTESKIGAKSG